MSEWKATTLGGISISIQYGYTESASSEPIGPKFLRITDIQDNFIDWDSVPYCKINNEEFKKYKLNKGDICIARTGNSTGATAFIKDDVEAVFASYLIRYQLDTRKAQPDFVGFLLRSSYWYKFVQSVKGGSAQAGANANSFASFPILLPSLKEQEGITAVLSCFDRKIENLRKQNKTLETIAHTLFKHWFVDFEFPNEDGKPYKSSGGAMERSELGEIPAGWRVGKFRDITAVINGRAYKQTEFREEGTPIVRIQNLTGKGQTVYSDLVLDKDKYISKGDLIYAWSATFGPYIWRGVKSIYHYHIWKLNCFNPTFKYYLYIHLKKVSDRVQGQGTGSIFTHITKELMESQELSIADEKVMERWHSVATPIFDKIMMNYEQIKTLTQTRDVLLPKLMSGKLHITE